MSEGLVAQALSRLKVHEHDGIPTFLFDCQRCADLDVIERELAHLHWYLDWFILPKPKRPWWRCWR